MGGFVFGVAMVLMMSVAVGFIACAILWQVARDWDNDGGHG